MNHEDQNTYLLLKEQAEDHEPKGFPTRVLAQDRCAARATLTPSVSVAWLSHGRGI